MQSDRVGGSSLDWMVSGTMGASTVPRAVIYGSDGRAAFTGQGGSEARAAA